MATRYWLLTDTGRKAHEDYGCVHIDNPSLTRITEEERQRRGLTKCSDCTKTQLPTP